MEIKEVTKMLKRLFVEMKIPVGTANAVVSITAPPVCLDVNLEPSKLSVFIEGQERLFEAIEEKARSHFGLDVDENAPPLPNSNSPPKPEQVPRTQPTLVENVQEETIFVPPSASDTSARPSQGNTDDDESSSLPNKSLSMSSSGDASFVEVSWAGQQGPYSFEKKVLPKSLTNFPLKIYNKKFMENEEITSS